ncbi:hypothetical protein AB0H36_12040 [Kribbella sp. NPDC050820]|uniref:hypothetical protein n=1 Tax=Kribbella sp. NPDC050820 TaxID=3155408 RepID=UPI0034038D33
MKNRTTFAFRVAADRNICRSRVQPTHRVAGSRSGSAGSSPLAPDDDLVHAGDARVGRCELARGLDVGADDDGLETTDPGLPRVSAQRRVADAKHGFLNFWTDLGGAIAIPAASVAGHDGVVPTSCAEPDGRIWTRGDHPADRRT